jgi:hypothetical protein
MGHFSSKETKVAIHLWWISETRVSPNKKIVVHKHLSPKHYGKHATHFLLESQVNTFPKHFHALEISFRKNFKS